MDLEPSTFIQGAKFNLNAIVEDCRDDRSHNKLGSFKILHTVRSGIAFEPWLHNAVKWNTGAQGQFKDHRRRTLSRKLTCQTEKAGWKDVRQRFAHGLRIATLDVLEV